MFISPNQYTFFSSSVHLSQFFLQFFFFLINSSFYFFYLTSFLFKKMGWSQFQEHSSCPSREFEANMRSIQSYSSLGIFMVNRFSIISIFINRLNSYLIKNCKITYLCFFFGCLSMIFYLNFLLQQYIINQTHKNFFLTIYLRKSINTFISLSIYIFSLFQKLQTINSSIQSYNIQSSTILYIFIYKFYNNQIMGNFTKPNPETLPKYYSYPNTKDMINELNTFCKQNARDLGFQLYLRASDLQYNHHDWKKSNVPGTVTIYQNLSRSQTLSAQPKLQKTYNIIMNVKNIYKSHQTMKHFQKRISQSRRVQETPTGLQQQQCCLCMDKTPAMMLPCYHSYCSNCIQIHIIQKQEKKCPICRFQFKEDNQSLQKKMIVVIGDQNSIMKDLREILLEYLREFNSHQVKEIQRELEQKQKGISGGYQFENGYFGNKSI